MHSAASKMILECSIGLKIPERPLIVCLSGIVSLTFIC